MLSLVKNNSLKLLHEYSNIGYQSDYSQQSTSLFYKS